MDAVARRIESLIRSGELRVGSRLPPEPELAAMLGVSRSSLREGLKGLMFLGLIKARPGRGTYIQSSLGRGAGRHFQWMVLLREVKYLELYELRKILEPTVAAIAARRASVEDLEKIALSFPGVEKCYAVQAGRELRVFVQPDRLTDEQSFALARNIALKIENNLQYPGQIKITVIRETRCVELAK